VGNWTKRAALHLLFTLTIIAGGVWGWRHRVEAANACGQGRYASLTLLARPGLGYSFTKVDVPDDVGPYLDLTTNMAMVPIRALMAVLSPATDSVHWEETTRTATFVRGTHTLTLRFPVGLSVPSGTTVNGAARPIQAVLCNGKVYAPGRQVAESLGVGIRWYEGRVVVMDPAWDPELEAVSAGASGGETTESAPAIVPNEYLRYVTTVAEVSPTWTSLHSPQAPAGCGSWPGSVTRLLLAPAESAREMARASACRWIRDRQSQMGVHVHPEPRVN